MIFTHKYKDEIIPTLTDAHKKHLLGQEQKN